MIRKPSRSYLPFSRMPFDRARCTVCGECLHRCPVVPLPLNKARSEWESLLSGKRTPILRRCTSCLTCDVYCPQDCRPANLVLARWRESYERKGLPARANYCLPHSRPNFRTHILA